MDELLAERFMLADAVRRGEMPEAVFRDWLIENTDEEMVQTSVNISHVGWLYGGADYVMSHPIASVSIIDREPYKFDDGVYAWCNWTSGGPETPDRFDQSELPSIWMRYLRGGVGAYYRRDEPFGLTYELDGWHEALTRVMYATQQEAIDDLSRAAVAWARDVALQRMGVHLAC